MRNVFLVGLSSLNLTEKWNFREFGPFFFHTKFNKKKKIIFDKFDYRQAGPLNGGMLYRILSILKIVKIYLLIWIKFPRKLLSLR